MTTHIMQPLRGIKMKTIEQYGKWFKNNIKRKEAEYKIIVACWL